MPPTLRSERLHLEPYSPEDEEDFVALFQDRRVSQWMGDGPSTEAEDRALFGRIFTKVYAKDLFDVWAVRRDGRYVGHAEIKPSEEVQGHEIVYALTPDAWGSGLGRELAETIVAHGFGTLGLTEVHATVAAPNSASLALLEKIGFEHVRDIAEDDGSTTCVLTRRFVNRPHSLPATAPPVTAVLVPGRFLCDRGFRAAGVTPR
ncbi:hypothetical protein GCM10010430_73970 [Kitasatospora cystarginea]|uniref:N-acetyltransferase domain-containing protein n=1 Tax=Kitasatospora cystarginea TaxID=58350 RepID=A0ABP5RVK9_9ACTN